MKISSASVKVMRSYDYCHFEVALSVDEGELVIIDDVDELRKTAMRLADKAVEQYKVAKRVTNEAYSSQEELRYLNQRVAVIRENYPKSEWSEEQKATMKAYDDHLFRSSLRYNYEDDWDIDESNPE